MATEPLPDHAGASATGRRDRRVRRDGGARPRRARARPGRQHPLRRRACRSSGTPAPARSAPAASSSAATGEIYLLSTWDEGVPEEIPHDHLYGITWNPMNFVTVLQGASTPTAEPAPRRHRRAVAAVRAAAADGLPRRGDRRRRPGAAAGATDQDHRGGRRASAPPIGVADAALAAAVGRAATRRDRTRADRRVHGRDGVAGRHHAGHAGRRPHRLAPVPGAAPATGASAPATSSSFDAGVVADGYAGEVGRTWPVGPNGDTAPRRRRPLPPVGRAVGRGCSTPAGPARRPAASSTPTAPAGEPLPAGADRHAASASASTTRSSPATCPPPPPRERLDPGVVLVVTASVIDDAVGSVIAHEPVLITPDGPEVLSTQPVLEPRTSRSPPMTDSRSPSDEPTTRPTGSSTRRTRRPRSPRSR